MGQCQEMQVDIPVVGIQAHGSMQRGDGFAWLSSVDEDESENCMAFGEVGVDIQALSRSESFPSPCPSTS